MVSIHITLFAQTATFDEDIQEWRKKSTNFKTWASFGAFFHRAHIEQRGEVTTEGEGG